MVKIRVSNPNSSFHIVFVDDWVHQLLGLEPTGPSNLVTILVCTGSNLGLKCAFYTSTSFETQTFRFYQINNLQQAKLTYSSFDEEKIITWHRTLIVFLIKSKEPKLVPKLNWLRIHELDTKYNKIVFFFFFNLVVA